MKYFTGGSLGDVFVNVVKLYNCENLEVSHYTKHKFWHKPITDIYSLIDVVPTFSDTLKQTLTSTFTVCPKALTVDPWPTFPKLDTLYQKFDLPEKYIVICQKTGRPEQKERCINNKYIQKIVNEDNRKVVLIGTDKIYDDKRCINLVGKTTLLEALSITAHASEVHSYHGLFGFFPLSQKIPTTIYEKSDRLTHSCKSRILPEWETYLKGFVK